MERPLTSHLGLPASTGAARPQPAKGLDPGLTDVADHGPRSLPAPVQAPPAPSAGHSLSESLNFSRAHLRDLAQPLRGVPFGCTEEGAIVLGHPDKADTLAYMPMGPDDQWIRLYMDQGISGGGKDRYMSYLQGTFRDMAKDLLENFQDLEVYQGLDVLKSLGLAKENGRIALIPEGYLDDFLDQKGITGEGLLFEPPSAGIPEHLQGVSRVFSPKELESAGLEGGYYRLNDGVLEVRYLRCGGNPEEPWGNPDPYEGQRPEVTEALRPIQEFLERTLAEEASRAQKIKDLMVQAGDARVELEYAQEEALTLALEDLSSWLQRAGWTQETRFELWVNTDQSDPMHYGQLGWEFMLGGESEFPTLHGPEGEEESFEDYLERYRDVLPAIGTYTFDGQNLSREQA